MGSVWRGLTCACLAAWLAISGHQQPAGQPQVADRLAAFERHKALANSSPFRTLTWQFLGPTNISGRVNDMAVADRGGHRRIYAAYSGSGLWASDDDAATWQPMFTDQAVTAITAVAAAPSNPSIVWILTGTSRSHIPLASAGVFRSIDAGRTWTHMGLADVGEGGFGRIVIHPSQPDTVYVAASGGPRPGNTRGVFKTRNGGRTWDRVLDRGVEGGVADLVMDPQNPETLYAATRPRARGNELPLWRAHPDDQQFSLFRTTDGGNTWSEIVNGLPEAKVRFGIGIDVSPSHPNVLYSVIDVRDRLPPNSAPTDLRIYRSEDRGASWRRVNFGGDQMEPWVKAVRVDPHDDQTLVAFGVRLYVSHDGGRTFRRLDGPHNDHNEFRFDPTRPGLAYDCSDGGLYVHEGIGAGWTLTAASPTSQIYDVALDMSVPFRVYSAVQDQLSFRGVVDLRGGRDRVPATWFERAPGEEVTSHGVDPGGRYVFAAIRYNGGALARFDLSSAAGMPRVASSPVTPRAGPNEPALRGAWLMPILLSPADAKTVFIGYQYLYRSADSGTTWERISPDLTSGGPGERAFPDYSNLAITTVSESPQQHGLIYAGTDDGHLHMTRDGGKSWTELTNNLPRHVWIAQVVASEHDAGTVYVVNRAREDDDFSPYLYKSTDYGATFASLVANLPAVAVNVIREDAASPRALYAGTDFGVYASTDTGSSWNVLGGNLPPVPVTDIQIHPRDRMLVIATFGRGVWVLDGLKIRPTPEVKR